jgi:hypothetical protein
MLVSQGFFLAYFSRLCGRSHLAPDLSGDTHAITTSTLVIAR